MSILSVERPVDSPYVAAITQGLTVALGTAIRPAEFCWHMVFVRRQGRFQSILVGPLTSTGVVAWRELGVEILWVKFQPGVWMPHWSTRQFIDRETRLAEAGSRSFWLHGSAWEIPTLENAETFVERLVQAKLLARDPIVTAALQDQPVHLSSRTLRHHFLHTTGLTYSRIRQIERAQLAVALLSAGAGILDVVDRLGYYDQPHLNRALKQWIGFTPGQIRNVELSA